ncbi:MAG: hypothetical protein QF830_05040, partial [Rhodospirillales bacterium]|nr:hypothetical protein [Rhodospirillales bacterium]
WDVGANFDFIRSKIDFRTAPKGRTDGTFTKFDSLDDKMDNVYYHMQFIKFGFGRATRDASRQIQNRRRTRDEALKLVRQYDDEFPKTHFPDSLDYLGMGEPEFVEIVDMHRNPEIWNFKGSRWKLRYPPA